MHSHLFYILFDHPTKSYFVGQTVTGRVVFECTSPKIVQGLKIKFRGYASVSWSEGSGKDQKIYSDIEQFFKVKFYHLGDGKSDITIKEGRTEYPFEFQLPTDIPSSFKGAYGKVVYEVLAVMQRAGIMKDYKVDTQISVNAIVDLNMNAGVSEPSEISKFKTLCCLCCASGPVSYIMKIPRTGYAPGEFLFFEAEMQNNCGRQVNGVKVSLVQFTHYFAGASSTTQLKVLAKVNRGGVEPGDSDVWRGSFLQIPPVPPTKLGKCRIIDVQYQLHLEMDIKGPALNLRGFIPITIGTIPLRSYFQALHPQNRELFPEPASPFQDYPDLPPPSYREAVFLSGDGSMDAGKDNVGADVPREFVPKYVTYGCESTLKENQST